MAMQSLLELYPLGIFSQKTGDGVESSRERFAKSEGFFPELTDKTRDLVRHLCSHLSREGH